MKNLKNYNNKTKAAFVLLIVMLLILLSNFNTLHNSKKTNQTINDIFKDRLVVADYIVQYVHETHFIKAQAQRADLSAAAKKETIEKAFKRIQKIDPLYLETVLSANEEIHIRHFITICQQASEQVEEEVWQEVVQTNNQMLHTLKALSKIQINEGKLKLAAANTLYGDNNRLGQLQIALLIVLSSITFYLLLIKKPKRTIKIPEGPSMN